MRPLRWSKVVGESISKTPPEGPRDHDQRNRRWSSYRYSDLEISAAADTDMRIKLLPPLRKNLSSSPETSL